MGRKAKPVQTGDEEDEYMDLTPKQYLAMIDFVKKNPPLWDQELADYHNNIMTSKLYKEMGRMILQLGGTGECILSFLPRTLSGWLHFGLWGGVLYLNYLLFLSPCSFVCHC